MSPRKVKGLVSFPNVVDFFRKLLGPKGPYRTQKGPLWPVRAQWGPMGTNWLNLAKFGALHQIRVLMATAAPCQELPEKAFCELDANCMLVAGSEFV